MIVKKYELQLAANIIVAARSLTKSINNYFDDTDISITMEQLEVLLHIASNSDKQFNQTEISNLMVKNKSGIVKTIDALEKKNYLRRITVPSNRRNNILEITPEGNKITEEASRIFSKKKLKHFDDLEIKDINTCIKVLNIIRKSV